jgi:hypothetical protein
MNCIIKIFQILTHACKGGAPSDEIRRENLKDFFLSAFFNRCGVPADDGEEIEEYDGRASWKKNRTL